MALFARRCPRCGRGKLADGLLAVAEGCGECGLDPGPHDRDLRHAYDEENEAADTWS